MAGKHVVVKAFEMKAVETKRTHKRMMEKQIVVQQAKVMGMMVKSKCHRVRGQPQAVVRILVVARSWRRKDAVCRRPLDEASGPRNVVARSSPHKDAVCRRPLDEASGPRNVMGDNRSVAQTDLRDEAVIDEGACLDAAARHRAHTAWQRGMNLVPAHTAPKVCANSEATPRPKTTTEATTALSLGRQSSNQEY